MGEPEAVSLKDSGTCQFVRENGERCRRPLGGGQKLCWQHSRGLRTRLRSLTRNQSVGFCIAVFGVVATLILGTIPLLRTDLNKRPTVPAESPDSPKTRPVAPTEQKAEDGKQTGNQNETDPSSAIGRLSALGWQIQPGEGNRIQFSDIYKHISIRQSAPYFCVLDRPFNVNIVGAKSLDGLDGLRNAKHLVRLDLNAAEVNDLSELRYLHNIQIFVMGQTAGHVSDLSPLRGLTNLKELGLDSAAIRDLTPIQGLTNITKLSIGGTQVSDLSPLRNFRHLQSLNLGGAPVADLSPLANINTLKEMQITGREVRSLSTFPRKDSLKSLSIFESQYPVDLSPIAELSGLEMLGLSIFGPQGFDVSPVQRLGKLTKLSITGDGFEYISPVRGLAAIDELHHLKELSLFGVQVVDLAFVADLQYLEEVSVTNAPLSNISALSRIKTLKSVSLTGTSVVDISPLLDLPELKTLGIMRTPARSDVLTELERRGVKVQR